MKQLFLMRHGQSISPSETSDFERTLTSKGVEEQLKMAHWMAEKKCNIQEIWFSPFKRTTQSATLMAQIIKANTKEEFLLGDQFDSELLLKKLRESSCDHLLLVGHEPSLALLIHKFLKTPANFKLSTSCLLQINFEDSWEWGKGEFVGLFTPSDR